MEFPDRVAACPQRTFAILTKYTALRSYYEQTVKGTPMDYEIAGLYTDSLLNSYMEYKGMWADLVTLIKDVSSRGISLKTRKDTDQLRKSRSERITDFDERLKRYKEAKAELEKIGAQNQVVLEQPLPANVVKPYDGDDVGLDKAQRDCRLEMIKIVREEVIYNPKIATDSDRNWRYLSPAIFRLLLPTDKERLPMPAEIEQMKTDLAEAVEKSLQLTKGRDRAEYGGKSYKNDISVYSKLLGHINNKQERQQDCGWPTQDV